MHRLLPSPEREYGSFCCQVAHNSDHEYEYYVLKDEQRATTRQEALELYGTSRAWDVFAPVYLTHNLTLDVWFASQPGTGSIYSYVPNPIAEKVAAECEKTDF